MSDALCRSFSPSTQAEALKESHCENIVEENLKRICKSIAADSGHDSSKVGEWSGTLKTIAASKGSGAIDNAGTFFFQFCVNPSTPQSNPKNVLCDIPAPTRSETPLTFPASPSPAPGPTPTPAPDPEPQAIPGYEIFVVQTLTDDVKAWGPPGKSKFGSKHTCQSLHCFRFDHSHSIYEFILLCLLIN